MHKYYLVTPLENSPSFDPGVTFITHGCKHLISQADPQAYFSHISNTKYSKPDWDLLFDQAQCLILAGNPLYDPTDIQVYWNFEIWDHVNEAISRGIPVADLWGYSSYPLPTPPIDETVINILSTSRTQRLLEIQSHFSLIITRDHCAQRIASTSVIDADVLPCCSFWAHRYFAILPKKRLFNCVTLRHMPGREWVLEVLYLLSQKLSNQLPTYLLCHTRHEYWWAKEHLPEAQNIICIYDPRSLLDFYAACDKVLSIRLHGSIPALSLGCQVINISIDSRSQALVLFDIPSVPYTDLKNLPIDLTFHSRANFPPLSIDYFIKLFQQKIVSLL